MALAATEITLKHLDTADAAAIDAIQWIRGHHDGPRVRFVEDVAESCALSQIEHGALIIAASGMCDGGRIRQHLQANLSRPECSVIFTGFQADGTLGRQIIDGAATVRIDGRDVPVRADVHTIGGLSAHADRGALLEWLAHFSQPPRDTFVVHGEAATALRFAAAVRNRFRWRVHVPAAHDFYDSGNAQVG